METKTIKIEQTIEIPDYATLLAKNNEKLAILNENNAVLSRTVEIKAENVLDQMMSYVREVVLPLFDIKESYGRSFKSFEISNDGTMIYIYFNRFDFVWDRVATIHKNGCIKIYGNTRELTNIEKYVKLWANTKYRLNAEVKNVIDYGREQAESKNRDLTRLNNELNNFHI